jgi:hypothetical protein
MDDKVTWLSDLSWGYRAARVLHVANEIDLFTTLYDKEMALEEICQKCSTKPDMTEKLLIACTRGILSLTPGKYVISGTAWRMRFV